VTGVVAFHLSNRHLDLGRVVRGIAEAADLDLRYVASPGERDRAGTSSAQWALVSRYRPFLDHPRVRLAAELEFNDEPVVWTDQRSSVLGVLESGERPHRRWIDAPNHGCFVIDSGNLLAREHSDYMLWRMRQLYADTHGERPLFVLTVGELPPGIDRLDSYAQAAFRQLGLATAESLATLVVIQRDGKTVQMSAQLGNRWSNEFRDKAKAEFQKGIAAGLTKGSFSYSIATGMHALERSIRTGTTVSPDGSQLARPGR